MEHVFTVTKIRHANFHIFSFPILLAHALAAILKGKNFQLQVPSGFSTFHERIGARLSLTIHNQRMFAF